MSGTSTIRTERRRFPRSDRAIGEHVLSRPSWVNGPRPATGDRVRVLPPAPVLEPDRATHRADELDRLRSILRDVAGVPGALADLNRILATCDRHVAPSACTAVGCTTARLDGPDAVDAFVADLAALDARTGLAPDGPALLPARRLRAFLLRLRGATAGARAA